MLWSYVFSGSGGVYILLIYFPEQTILLSTRSQFHASSFFAHNSCRQLRIFCEYYQYAAVKMSQSKWIMQNKDLINVFVNFVDCLST